MLPARIVKLFRDRTSEEKTDPLQRHHEAVAEAFRRGDYDAALREAEGLKGSTHMPEAYSLQRGVLLYHAGQLREAEACLQEGLRIDTNPRLFALRVEQLGKICLEQGKYNDAVAYFERSVDGWPDRGGGHRAVAEALLRQGSPPAGALRRARLAVDADRDADPVSPELYGLNLAQSIAVLAWAVAEDSRDSAEVHRLLDEAFQLCGDAVKPALAEVHYYAGFACAALGDKEDGLSHFVQAAALDPQGNYGRLARVAAAKSH